MTANIQRIGVVGAGAWGTALAANAAQQGRRVVLWAREAAVVAAVNESHRNTMFLPDVALDPGIKAIAELAHVCDADAVMLVAPAQFLRPLCRELAAHWRPGTPALICAKGIEQHSGELMSEVVAAELSGARLAVLSGPTFAAEVAKGLPAAVTLACEEDALGAALVEALGSPHFRPYLSSDVVGAQIGGAVKNVLAIACGIVSGRRLGDNARAALITRGLAEMIRLALAKGASRETLMGLSGLGDLVLTCSSEQSRNMSLGLELGRGARLTDILAERRSVAEGVASAPAVLALAGRLGVEMPIAAAVDAILHHDASVDEAIAGLLSRPFKGEWD
ncbi:MAG: glycerol-3-phosphate acyltransferase [Rhodospirillaceae bacterium]|jgi:glycerol-3-phosphate dehydrogenase (NAD(P)+)|nr:glycerol-3-phosphate acyltransferase [Rhodospirillaceae bacterium]MDP6623912.1 NAD(P)H-dependent glycerol-3-phosphate dehydrogenase [Alphaproteobacteria bacterium]|tara:strand:- start:472 stop:1476 length:1005 start_codon:yes stop_codon:yes gene_type:complete